MTCRAGASEDQKTGRLSDHPQVHPDPCLSRRHGRWQVSWLADRRLVLPSRRHTAASGLTGRDFPLTVAGAAADLAGAYAWPHRIPYSPSSRGTIDGLVIDFAGPACQSGRPGFVVMVPIASDMSSEQNSLSSSAAPARAKAAMPKSLIAALPPPVDLCGDGGGGRRRNGGAHRRSSRAARRAMADRRSAARSAAALAACAAACRCWSIA